MIQPRLLLLVVPLLFCVGEGAAKSGGWGNFPTRQRILAVQTTPSVPVSAIPRESSAKLPPPVAPGTEEGQSTVRNPDLPAGVTIEKNPAVKPADSAPKEDLAAKQASEAAAAERKERIKTERERLNHNAFVWQQERAAAGSASAQRSLAMRYLTGDGVAKDETKGMDLLRKAAASGESAAQKELAKREPAKKE